MSFTNLALYDNDIPEIIDPIPFNVTARSCEPGERYGSDLSCEVCQKGFYLYDNQLEPGECLSCNEEEVCLGGNITTPKDNYWRTGPLSENYYQCFRPESCLEGNWENPLGVCEEGYDGIMCANCVGDYYRTDRFTCKECPDPFTNMMTTLITAIVLIVIIVFLVQSSIDGSNRKKPLYSVYLKIFLNHYQLLQVISSIDFTWPEEIQWLL